MRYRWLTCAFASAAAIALCDPAWAGDDDRPTEPVITATVTIPADDPPAGPDNSGGGPAEPAVCEWRAYPASPGLAAAYNTYLPVLTGDVQTVIVDYYVQSGTLHRYNSQLGRFERRITAHCSDPTHPDHLRTIWQAVAAPDPAGLLSDATRTATEQIQFPQPQLSPIGDIAINLGVWLAVAEAGPYTARAAFTDDVWAETTATLASTTFQDGDEPPITCTGNGSPIVDTDTVEPGPCGFVYSDYDDIGPHTMTITSTWAVTWRLSNGSTGQAADITVTSEHAYRVFEIQTVGVSG